MIRNCNHNLQQRFAANVKRTACDAYTQRSGSWPWQQLLSANCQRHEQLKLMWAVSTLAAVMSPALTAVILGTFTPPAIIGLMTCSQQTQPSSHFSVTDGVETSGSQLAQVQLGLRAAIIARGRARPPESPSRSRRRWIPHNSIIKKNFGSLTLEVINLEWMGIYQIQIAKNSQKMAARIVFRFV